MKKSSQVIIFLGLVLWVEFVGTVVYRTLINDNHSPKEDGGPESYSFNEEKANNGVEDLERQVGKFDVAGAQNGMIEKRYGEQGVSGSGKDEDSGNNGVGQDESEEKAESEAGVVESGKQDSLSNAIENAAVIINKGLCTCTEQGKVGGEDGVGDIEQESQTEKDDLEDRTEGNGRQGNIDEEPYNENGAENEDAKSEQPGSEMGGADGKVEDAETTKSASAEQGRISQESGLETNTEKEENGEYAEMDTNHGNTEQIFRFSPLNR